MRAYLQSNHINSRDVTSSRVHYVVTAGGKRKRKKRKRVLRVILDLTYNIQHTETENKFLKKKPEKKKKFQKKKQKKKKKPWAPQALEGSGEIQIEESLGDLSL